MSSLNTTIMATQQQAIETAKKFLDDGRPDRAAHVLRDLPVIESLGLHDLAWAMCHEDAYVSNADINYIINQIQGA